MAGSHVRRAPCMHTQVHPHTSGGPVHVHGMHAQDAEGHDRMDVGGDKVFLEPPSEDDEGL